MSRPTHAYPSPLRRAFTLVELLVVIVIIAILAGLALVVGGKVTKGGEKGLTENTLRVLDATLTSYLADREGKFPTYYVDEMGQVFPIVDGRSQNAAKDAPYQPSIALYLLIAGDVPSVQETLKGLDPKLLVRKPVADVSTGQILKDKNGQPIDGLYVNDAWGNPIRFVLPRYHGGHGGFADSNGAVNSGRSNLRFRLTSAPGQSTDYEFRRSYRPYAPAGSLVGPGDADEGMCPSGRPYFYSAGPDGDPGTRDDNVYTNVPQFPLETRDLK